MERWDRKARQGLEEEAEPGGQVDRAEKVARSLALAVMVATEEAVAMAVPVIQPAQGGRAEMAALAAWRIHSESSPSLAHQDLEAIRVRLDLRFHNVQMANNISVDKCGQGRPSNIWRTTGQFRERVPRRYLGIATVCPIGTRLF
jgi:hypothetical protein